MLSPKRRYLKVLLAAAVTLLPASTEARIIPRSSEALNPRAAAIVRVTDTVLGTRFTQISVEFPRPLTSPASRAGTTTPRRWLVQAADWDAFRAHQQPAPQKRSWIQRHPAIFGALVGFGGGFLIGYLPGDDGVFDDFTAGFNGWVMGGVGAATGGAVGAIVGALTR
jgi:hypothetical protein